MDIKSIIIDILGRESYLRGKNIEEYDIAIGRTIKNILGITYSFYVDNSDYSYNACSVRTENGRLRAYSCNCSDFKRRRTCKHLAAVFLNYSELFFPAPISPIEVTETLLDEYILNPKENVGIKEPLKFLIELDLYYEPSFKIHVGINKTYQLNSETKFKNFIDAYDNGNLYKLGKYGAIALNGYSPENKYQIVRSNL